MTVAILIGVLIGCGLISIAIRARLLNKRKGQPLPALISTSDNNIAHEAGLGATAIKLPIQEAPAETEAVSGQRSECFVEPPADAAISSVGTQAANISDPVDFTSATIRTAARIAELNLASDAIIEACAEAAPVVLLEASSAPNFHAPEHHPEPFSQNEAECPTPVSSEMSASRARLTESPASGYLAVAPPPNVPDTGLQENSAAAVDTPHEGGVLDAELIRPYGFSNSGGSAEIAQTGAGAAGITLEPRSISVLQGAENASDWAEENGSTVAVYRPPILSAKHRRSGTEKSSPSARVLKSSLDVRLQLLVSRTADIHAGLLFKRPEGFPVSLAVKIRGNDVQLSAYGDGWYTADVPSQFSLAYILKEGFIASERVIGDVRTSWMLSAGREIYVAAPQPGAAGYHSVPRLMLGCAQLVVARDHLQNQVTEILAESCGKVVQRLAADCALLPGWAVFGPVTPLKPVAHREGDECLNVIRPLPELVILLEGGLCLRGAEWLEGFPPRIILAGPIPGGERVLIDNVAASADSTSAYKTPGCYSIGEHTVWCAGTSRTYRMSAAPQFWEPWSAHAQQKGTVCGAITEYVAFAPGAQLITIPCSNRVLIGAEPGQLHMCSGQAEDWTGLVPFAPVWGLPANPFRCRKNVARVMLLCARPITLPSGSGPKAHSVRAWCAAILDCKRKGLEVQSPGAASLWDEYTRAARSVWRSVS